MEACTACQRLASDPRSLHDRRRVVLKYQEDAPLSGRRRYASNTYVCDRCQTGWWVSRRGLRPQQGEVWTVDRRTHDRRAVDRGYGKSGGVDLIGGALSRPRDHPHRKPGDPVKTVLAIAAAALLTACGTLVNDKPRANFSVDMNHCVAEAERAIPVVYGTHFEPGTSQVPPAKPGAWFC